MAHWYSELYVSEAAAPYRKKIINAVNRSRPIPGAYLITLRTCETDQLDIYDMMQLKIPGLAKRAGTIIGIAMGRTDAFELLARIAEEVYSETGGADIRGTIEAKIRNGEASVS